MSRSQLELFIGTFILGHPVLNKKEEITIPEEVLTTMLDTVRRKQKDESVTHVLIQCGFNDLKQPNF